jgi:hypothetical protein
MINTLKYRKTIITNDNFLKIIICSKISSQTVTQQYFKHHIFFVKILKTRTNKKN